MNDIAVIYKSKYGSSQKYAEWLARELKTDMLVLSDVTEKKLAGYTKVVYCAGLYAGGMNGFSKMKKLLEKAPGKKLILCGVGASDPESPAFLAKIKDEIRKKNLASDDKETPVFFLRGAMDYRSMNHMDKLMMNMLRKVLLKKEEAERTAQDKLMLESFYDKNDWTSPNNLAPVLEYLQNERLAPALD